MTTSKIRVTYFNQNKYYQVLRIADLHCYVERVIAPEQEIVFEAFVDSIVEIYTTEFVTTMLAKRTFVSDA